MLPSLAYFFAARSQTNYLIPLIPVALVAAVTAGPPAARRAPELGRRVAGVVRGRRWRGAIAALGVLGVAAVIYAFSSTSPLTVKIVGQRTTGFLGGIKTLIVKVHNGTSKPQTPAYTVQTSHGDTTFWKIQSGPKTIAPGHTAKVESWLATIRRSQG